MHCCTANAEHQGLSRFGVSDLRRDFRTDTQETFEVILDTFGDRRNGYLFATNAAGARADQQVTNEGRETNTSIHRPLSNLFVVYNEQRFTGAAADRPGRSLTVKFTQMFGF